MQNKVIATTSEAARIVAANRRYARNVPPISAEQAAAEIAPLFPEKIGRAPLDALPEPPAFTRPDARRPIDRPASPCLQWATGLPTKDKAIYAGWLIEAGRDADLDDAMGMTDFAPVTIKHGSGNLVTHWAMPIASLFVVCDGVQTITEMRDTPDRYGIAFGWRTVGANGPGSGNGRQQSVLRARVFVQELLSVGYDRPLILSLKSTLTGDLLACLIRHYTVLDSINPIRKTAGKDPIAVPYYAVALRLGAGDEVQRGSGGASKEITPMVEIGPRDREYVLKHWCKRDWVQAIEQVADDTVIWSRGESVRIASGEKEEWES
jgi:hypothetical protein